MLYSTSLNELRGKLSQSATIFLASLFMFLASSASTQAQSFDYLVETDVVFDFDGVDPIDDFSGILAGDIGRILITVVNDGPAASPATTLSFPLPGSSTFEGATASLSGGASLTNCTEDAGIVTCDVPALAAPVGNVEDFADIVISFGSDNVTSPVGEAWNASPTVVTQAGESELDNNLNEFTITVSPSVDLSIAVNVPGNLTQGEIFNFNLVATNAGPVTAEGYTVTAQVPAGVVITDLPSGCTQAGTTVTCVIDGQLPPNTPVQFDFEARLVGEGPIVIQGEIAPNGIVDRDQTNNIETGEITTTVGTDLFISKELTGASRGVNETVVVGDDVEFTVTPQFIGATPATITVTDTFPVFYETGTQSLAPSQCGVVDRTITCTFAASDVTGPDANGVSSLPVITYELRAGTAVAEGDNINQAVISGPTGLNDPNPDNNIGVGPGVLIAPPSSDLAISKSQPFPATTVVGGTLLHNFTLTARNAGTVNYEGNVIVTDVIQTNVEVRTLQRGGVAGATNWSCQVVRGGINEGAPIVVTNSLTTLSPAIVGPADLVCTAAYSAQNPLGSGDSAPSIVLGTATTAAGNYANVARVNGPDSLLNVVGNDTDTETYIAEEPDASTDLGILKRGGLPVSDGSGGYLRDGNGNIQFTPGPAVTNEPYLFELEVTNSGPITALDIRVRDRIAVFNNNATFDLVEIRNVATGVANNCTQTLRGGTSPARELQCSIASVPVCTAGVDCPVITVIARLGNGSTDPASEVTNVAEADSITTPDPDQSNNRTSIDIDFTGIADLTVTKTANRTSVNAGSDLSYTIVVRNDGNSNRRVATATNIVLFETLPADVEFISASVNTNNLVCTGVAPGTILTDQTQNTLRCEIRDAQGDNIALAAGQQRVVTIVVRPQSEAIDDSTRDDITNDVRVAMFADDGVTEVTPDRDLNTDNNTASVSTNVLPPLIDIGVQKTDSEDPLALNELFTYSVTVTNFGLEASNNVRVVDSFPTNGIVEYVGVVTPAGVTCEPPRTNGTGLVDQITCTRPGAFAPGASFSIDYQAISRTVGVATNTVAVFSTEIDNGRDGLRGNNSSSENTTVKALTDVFVTKVSEEAEAAPGEIFNFVATVGVTDDMIFSRADDVEFTDILPEGMEFAGTPAPSTTVGSCVIETTGALANRQLDCALGDIERGATVTITIPVVVPSVTEPRVTFTNNASVTTSSPERAAGTDNNDDTADVDIVAPSLSGTVYRDINDDGSQAANDTPVEGVVMTLRDENGVFLTTTITDENGDYSFPLLPTGIYQVERGPITDDFSIDGDSYPQGGSGTRASQTLITAISVTFNVDSPDNDFTILPQPVVGLTKAGEIVAQNADGSFDATYTFVVTNFSLEAIDQITIRDTLAGADPAFGTLGTAPLGLGQYLVFTDPNGSCGTGNTSFDGSGDTALVINGGALAVGESCEMSVTLRVLPTLARVADDFVNQATVDAVGAESLVPTTDLSNDGDNPDSNDNGQPNEDDDNVVTTVTPNSATSLTLVKSGVLSVPADEVTDEDSIEFSFLVTNTGDVTLTNINIVDAMIAAQRDPVPAGNIIATIPVLLPLAETTVTATYELTQLDVDNETVFNQASASGTDPFGRVADDIDDTTVPLLPQPGISLVKTGVLDGAGSPTSINDVVTYNFVVENTGDVTLSDVVIIDPLIAAQRDPVPADNVIITIGTLAPGETAERQATYLIVQDDINNGQVVNLATARGTEPNGQDQVEDDSEATVETTRNISLNAVKTQTVEDLGDIGVMGLDDVITYEITVTNDGNVALSDVSVLDTLTDFLDRPLELDGLSPPAPQPVFVSASLGSDEGTLLLGETATYSATFTVNAQAVEAGGVSNTVLATGGFDPDGDGPDPIIPTDDRSDDGDDDDGNTEDDPTELELSPIPDASGVTMTKTTPSQLVKGGDVVSYTITLTNDNAFQAGLFELVDRLPNGMIYIPGSATLDGEPADVTFTAGRVTWPEIVVPAFGTTVATLETRVLNGARSGTLTNVVSLIDPETGEAVLDDASADVRIAPEPVFECSDVVGKVFNDVNGNGYQDAPDTIGRGQISDQSFEGGKGKLSPFVVAPDEDGIPNVRIATVDGTIITTDENGLFSVPCASLPAGAVSNYILKVDTRSLPAGFRMTTSNPSVSSVSPGTMTEMNFGASASLQVVRIDLTGASFVQTDTGPAMTPALRDGVNALLRQIAGSPSNLVLTFYLSPAADASAVNQARDLLDLVEDQIRSDWRTIGQVRLQIEQSIMRAGQ